MNSKIDVAVLGATGMVGQKLLTLLDEHPWFSVSELIASNKRTGHRYDEVVDWRMRDPLPESTRRELKGASSRLRSPLIFSCISGEVARKLEPEFAERGHLVVSNASAFRMHPDVPLIIPEVNAAALALLTKQRSKGSPGGIVTNPNCVVAGLALGLAPIHRAAEIRRADVVTLQAVSGAGLPGPPSMSMIDNVIPWIKDEEDKIQEETNAILDSRIEMGVAVHRVPVLHGHTMSVFIDTEQSLSPRDAVELWRSFAVPDVVAGLPSASTSPIHYTDDPDRPQPVLDRDRGNGMTITVGRCRSTHGGSLAFELCVHNLVRGAAGAALLNAELCHAQGWLT